MTLENRALGSTGLFVSPVGLGAGQLGVGSLGESDAERLIHGAVDAGVSLIDTARSYGLSDIGRIDAAYRRVGSGWRQTI